MPRKPDAVTRREPKAVRLAQEERDAIAEAARLDNQAVTVWMRTVLLEQARRRILRAGPETAAAS